MLEALTWCDVVAVASVGRDLASYRHPHYVSRHDAQQGWRGRPHPAWRLAGPHAPNRKARMDPKSRRTGHMDDPPAPHAWPTSPSAVDDAIHIPRQSCSLGVVGDAYLPLVVDGLASARSSVHTCQYTGRHAIAR
jgi:hypothetical protein